MSKSELSNYLNQVEFVTGDPVNLLSNQYKDADFVTVDFNVCDHNVIFKAARKCKIHNKGGVFVVGYNAQNVSPLEEGHFLPIGEGLLVSKVPKSHDFKGFNGKRSK